jgi:CBS domain-containing protein
MAGWVEVSLPKALLEAAICFDFRPLYGDAALTASLRDWIGPRMRANPAFLRRLAEAALEARPALGRLGGFATEDAPGAAHSINLKLHGARIFVDAARVLALSHGAAETSTIGRLRAVRAATGAREGETEAMVHAFCFVQSMRLRVQAGLAEPARAQEARSAAEDAHNRLDPDTLDAFEQASLKEAMRLARELQSRLALDFQL